MRRYAFDVDPDSQALLNRRVFAYVDAGIPDGVQIDKDGNVYAGCGDGVQVCFFFLPSIRSSHITGVFNFFLTCPFVIPIFCHLVYSWKTRYGTLKEHS